jgi:hypothetical protein
MPGFCEKPLESKNLFESKKNAESRNGDGMILVNGHKTGPTAGRGVDRRTNEMSRQGS